VGGERYGRLPTSGPVWGPALQPPQPNTPWFSSRASARGRLFVGQAAPAEDRLARIAWPLDGGSPTSSSVVPCRGPAQFPGARRPVLPASPPDIGPELQAGGRALERLARDEATTAPGAGSASPGGPLVWIRASAARPSDPATAGASGPNWLIAGEPQGPGRRCAVPARVPGRSPAAPAAAAVKAQSPALQNPIDGRSGAKCWPLGQAAGGRAPESAVGRLGPSLPPGSRLAPG